MNKQPRPQSEDYTGWSTASPTMEPLHGTALPADPMLTAMMNNNGMDGYGLERRESSSGIAAFMTRQQNDDAPEVGRTELVHGRVYGAVSEQGVASSAGARPRCDGEPVNSDSDDAAATAVNDDDDEALSMADERKAMRRLLKGCKCYFESMPREVVVVHAKEVGFQVVNKIEQADIIWIEATPYHATDLLDFKPHQRINFFPGMKTLSTKCEFGRLVNIARSILAGHDDALSEMDFIPRTFVVPGDRKLLEQHTKEEIDRGNPICYVVKPDGGCGGDGIYLTNDINDIRHSECVVQEYVTNPLLLGGIKFDLRLYVLVTSIEPLRFAIYREGLARMAVDPYETPNKKNFHKLNMHLTNYSLNKFATNFVPNTAASDDAECSKRSITTAFEQLRAQDCGFDEEEFWDDFEQIVETTLQLMQPDLILSSRTQDISAKCFQVLGFDILLDEDMGLHLLEINHHPSLMTDAPIDMKVKGELLKRLVRMMSYNAVVMTKKRSRLAAHVGADSSVPDALPSIEEWEETQCGPLMNLHVYKPGESSLYGKWVEPLLQMKDIFITLCGGEKSKTYGEMGSTRLSKFARKYGIAGKGENALAGAIPTSSVDLIYIKRINLNPGATALYFMDFVLLMLEDFGDVVAPGTTRLSLERLVAVAQFLVFTNPGGM